MEKEFKSIPQQVATTALYRSLPLSFPLFLLHFLSCFPFHCLVFLVSQSLAIVKDVLLDSRVNFLVQLRSVSEVEQHLKPNKERCKHKRLEERIKKGRATTFKNGMTRVNLHIPTKNMNKQSM